MRLTVVAQCYSADKEVALEGPRCLLYNVWCLREDGSEAGLGWGCPPKHLHVASSAVWPQSGQASSMVAGFPQSKCPKRTRWKLYGLIWPHFRRHPALLHHILLVTSRSYDGPSFWVRGISSASQWGIARSYCRRACGLEVWLLPSFTNQIATSTIPS